ncbi:MAG TPA: AI-2E family transporter [Ohtaekwangia sp.]
MKDILQRVNLYLLSAILLTIVLYFGKTVIVPIMFAALLAMLMAPICRWLDAKGVNRVISCLTCVFILLITLLIVLGVTVGEIVMFAQDLPQIEKKAGELFKNLQAFVEDSINVSAEKQDAFVQKQIQNLGKSAGQYISKILGGLTTTIAGLLITLVFTFLFLYNKERYETFFLKLYKEEETSKVKGIVQQISTVSQKYLTGRAMSILILFGLYSIGLLIIGIKNAVLLAGVAALLTVVPYVGSTIGGIFPFLMALVTEDSVQPAFWVVAVIVFIQAMDNYFIEPNVVGGEVNLSALASIIVIICGGLIWGVSGMVLFIPMLAIIKIVCDHVEPLKPYGYILGDPDGNAPSRIREWIKEKFSKRTSSRTKRSKSKAV